jgi:hypothetical protein
MNGKEEDGTPFIVAVAELLAIFKQFVCVFGKYKRALCKIFPQRSEELDCYPINILQIETSYGEKFYESHKKPEARLYITYIVITTCTWVYFRETNFLAQRCVDHGIIHI